MKETNYENLLGQKIGKLTVVKFIENPHRTRGVGSWLCVCECGREVVFKHSNLVTRIYKSCGNHTWTSSQKIDLTGKRFAKLIVLSECESKKDEKRDTYWKCKCDCGNEIIVRGVSLRNGNTQSCGCTTINEKAYNNISYEEIYGAFWSHVKWAAKERNLPLIITIKEAWELFLKQDRKCALSGIELYHTKYISQKNRQKNSQKYAKGNASLDRIDSSKGYTVDNVQWVHKTINMMKRNLSDEEFIKFCKAVAQNNNSKNR